MTPRLISHATEARARRLTRPGAMMLQASLLVAMQMLHGMASAQADDGCGNPFANGYGPYDYRTNRGERLKVVEDYHFTPKVENLIKGISSSLGGELDYTLRAFPNHHRALVALVRLGDKLRSPQPPGAQFSIDCYFSRAIRFRPDDVTVRMVFASYLGSTGRKPDGIAQLDYGATLAEDNPFTQYNLGLVYLELGAREKALARAHTAMALGFTRTELADKLRAAGAWRDPVPAEAPTAPAQPAASAAATTPEPASPATR